MKMEITHENFDHEYQRVKEGKAIFFLPSYGRCLEITAKTIKRFEMVGQVPIGKHKDGKGFFTRHGKSTCYIMPDSGLRTIF